MTQKEVREALKNGEIVEGREKYPKGSREYHCLGWKEVHSDDKIHSGYEYRIRPVFHVVRNLKGFLYVVPFDEGGRSVFSGSEEECDAYLREHQVKWIDESDSDMAFDLLTRQENVPDLRSAWNAALEWARRHQEIN